MVDVHRHALIDRMLIDGRSIDNTGHGDILLTVGVRSWANTCHQERAVSQRTARATGEEPRGKKHHQNRDQYEQRSEFPHTAMVGLLA